MKSNPASHVQNMQAPMGVLRVLDQSLSHWQAQARSQIQADTLGEAWAENLFVTPNWGAFVAQSMGGSCDGAVNLVVPKKTHVFQPFSSPGTQATLTFRPGGGHMGTFETQLLEEKSFRTDPYGPQPHHLILPVYEAWGINLTHWSQVLDTNLMALYWQKKQLGLSSNNRLGRNVKIHPTAHVTGAVLKDHAVVEAFASVIDSQIGEKSRVAANSVLHTSVLGAGSQTLVDTHLRRVVVGQNTTIANLGLFDSLVGDDAFVTTAVSVFGLLPRQYPEIEGKTLYRPVIGVGIGDGAVVGARALFQAGVYLPKGAMVVGRPDEAASKLDEAHLKRAKMQIGDPLEQV